MISLVKNTKDCLSVYDKIRTNDMNNAVPALQKYTVTLTRFSHLMLNKKYWHDCVLAHNSTQISV
jgi:hypothetical protein